MSTLVALWSGLHPLLQMLIKGLLAIGFLFPVGGAASLAERKVAAWVANRPGPNRAIPIWFAWVPILGPALQRLGVFHLMADGIKMFLKEDPLPGHVNKVYFMLAPLVGMVPALTTVCVVPFGGYLDEAGRVVPLILANVDIGLLAVFAVSSMGVYALILAGWASNSKYPFLGSVRASAQLISYELSMTLSVLPVFLWVNAPGTAGSLSLARVVEFQSQSGLMGGTWFIFLMPISAVVFMVSLYAETNRLPFDMAEGEADLVGGFHTEYGSLKWGLFFVAEYSHMVIGSAVFTLLFLGGWNPLPWVSLAQLAALLHLVDQPVWLGLISIVIFVAKVFALIFVMMWVRFTVPRFRYDQVMQLGWRKLLPLAIGNLVFYAVEIAVLQTGQPWWAHLLVAVAAVATLAGVLFRPGRPQTL